MAGREMAGRERSQGGYLRAAAFGRVRAYVQKMK